MIELYNKIMPDDPVARNILWACYVVLSIISWRMSTIQFRDNNRHKSYLWKHALLCIAIGVVWPVSIVIISVFYLTKEIRKHNWSNPPDWM